MIVKSTNIATSLATLFLISPVSVLAGPEKMHTVGGDPMGFVEQAGCYRFEYREVYVPGTSESPGYVDTSRDKVEVPCNNRVGVDVSRNNQHSQSQSTPNAHYPHGDVGSPHHLAHGYHLPAPQYAPPNYQSSVPGPTIINNDRGGYQPYQPGYMQQNVPQSRQPQESNVQIRPAIAQNTVPKGDTNSCASGTILGALAGGAGAASFTKGGNDMLWSVPLGMIGGSMIGCQLNGG